MKGIKTISGSGGKFFVQTYYEVSKLYLSLAFDNEEIARNCKGIFDSGMWKIKQLKQK